MVIVQATMWPQGSAAQAYDLLHATITAQGDEGHYAAHVLARPNPYDGIVGYEADVEVKDHNPRAGLAPLLQTVLQAAHDPNAGVVLLPPARLLARVTLVDSYQFEALLRGGAR